MTGLLPISMVAQPLPSSRDKELEIVPGVCRTLKRSSLRVLDLGFL